MWVGWWSCTYQLLWIKVATNMRNIYPQEHETNVSWRKKALVWSLKQFHASNYWLYEKGMKHTMVGLQVLHSGNVLKCPSISAGVWLKSFCSWYLKLGETWRELLSTSVKCTTRWQLHVTFVGHLPAWLDKTLETIGQSAKGSMTKSMQSMMLVKCMERLRSCKTQKWNQNVTSQKQHPYCSGQNGASELLRSDKHGSTKDAAQEIMLSKMSLYVFLLSYSLLPSHPSEQTFILSLNDSMFFSQMVPHHILVNPWSVRQTVSSFLLVIVHVV